MKFYIADLSMSNDCLLDIHKDL